MKIYVCHIPCSLFCCFDLNGSCLIRAASFSGRFAVFTIILPSCIENIAFDLFSCLSALVTVSYRFLVQYAPLLQGRLLRKPLAAIYCWVTEILSC